MTIDELRIVDAKCRAETPKIFRLATPAARATPEMLDRVEALLGFRLSSKYRDFLTVFGGGDFGLVTVFSADNEDEWFLPLKQQELEPSLPQGCLAFSDDGAGGCYVLKVENGQAKDEVFYWNHEEQCAVGTPFADILEFVSRYAYHPA